MYLFGFIIIIFYTDMPVGAPVLLLLYTKKTIPYRRHFLGSWVRLRKKGTIKQSIVRVLHSRS